MTLEPGDPAPAVSAPNQDGEVLEPEFAEPTVVYFYPADGSPGCTTEAEQFQRERATYEDAGVAVYGVSTDDVASHREFAGELGVEFDLLADPDGEVADAFGVDRSRGEVERTTFVLDDGEVLATYGGVDPDGHARAVMLDLLDRGVVDLG